MNGVITSFEKLLFETRPVFPQLRTFKQAFLLAFGLICCWGRKTITQALCACHVQFEDWSKRYRVFSRSPWNPKDLFNPVIENCLIWIQPDAPLVVALDDTSLKKTGKKIPGVSYLRDPLSPPFHVNLKKCQRFIQASMLIRPEDLKGAARAIPIRFHPAPPPAKPGKKAKPEVIEYCKRAKKTENLSCQGAKLINDIKETFAGIAGRNRLVLFALDGSYCNRTVLRNLPEGTAAVARTRKDICLFAIPDPQEKRRKYGAPLPKPIELLRDNNVPWETVSIFGAGRMHQVKYKTLNHVLWQTGTQTKPLRLLVIAPLRYRLSAQHKLLYRKPAYLLVTDTEISIQFAIQAAFDRWEIEVNHRDEKSILGVGHAQVRSANSVNRVPQFQVALYSMLLLASLQTYGPKRTKEYLPLPKWRKKKERRPSILDIIALFRQELLEYVLQNGFDFLELKNDRNYSNDASFKLPSRNKNQAMTTTPVQFLDLINSTFYSGN